MADKRSYGRYLECPMCEVEVPMSGEETVGEQVFCPYCQSPLTLKIRKKEEKEELYLEEDF